MESMGPIWDYFDKKLENSLIKFPTSPSSRFTSLLELVSFLIKFLAWLKALFNSPGAWFTRSQGSIFGLVKSTF